MTECDLSSSDNEACILEHQKPGVFLPVRYDGPLSARPVLLDETLITNILYVDLSSPVIGRIDDSRLPVIQYVLRNDGIGGCGRGHETALGAANLIEGGFTIQDDHAGPVTVRNTVNLKQKRLGMLSVQELEHATAHRPPRRHPQSADIRICRKTPILPKQLCDLA